MKKTQFFLKIYLSKNCKTLVGELLTYFVDTSLSLSGICHIECNSRSERQNVFIEFQLKHCLRRNKDTTTHTPWQTRALRNTQRPEQTAESNLLLA